jgi:predicted aldo/keto reductase-like oxidoreductase
MRYNLLGNASHWFPGEKAENIDRLDFNSCLARSPHREKIPQYLAEAHDLLISSEVKRLSQQ